MKSNVHPSTPINRAYLELSHQDKNSQYLGKNLNFGMAARHSEQPNDQFLNCDEELELEQAREEIASLESDTAEVPIKPFVPKKLIKDIDQSKQGTTLDNRRAYYSDLDHAMLFDEG